MLHYRGNSKMVADQPMPFGMVIGVPEMHNMVFDGFPMNDQPVARRNLQ